MKPIISLVSRNEGGRLTIAQEISVNACQRILSGLRVCRVDETQVQQVTLALVDVRDEFAPFTERAEAIDSFGVVLAVRGRELYETGIPSSVLG